MLWTPSGKSGKLTIATFPPQTPGHSEQLAGQAELDAQPASLQEQRAGSGRPRRATQGNSSMPRAARARKPSAYEIEAGRNAFDAQRQEWETHRNEISAAGAARDNWRPRRVECGRAFRDLVQAGHPNNPNRPKQEKIERPRRARAQRAWTNGTSVGQAPARPGRSRRIRACSSRKSRVARLRSREHRGADDDPGAARRKKMMRRYVGEKGDRKRASRGSDASRSAGQNLTPAARHIRREQEEPAAQGTCGRLRLAAAGTRTPVDTGGLLSMPESGIFGLTRNGPVDSRGPGGDTGGCTNGHLH